MPMSSDVDVESQIQETAEDAVAKDGPFVPGVNCTNINDVSEFGDVEYYMWERYYIQNKSRGTIIQLSNAVTNLEKFIKQSDRFDCSVEDVDNRVAKQFKMWLVDRVQPSTAASYINELDSMAQFYLSDGYYPGNPFENLTDGINTSADDNSASYQTNERITVDDTKLREAIRSTHGSMKIVLLAVLVKTGIRLSEACNLDWEDINIDHPLADDLLPDSRFELSDDPDTIYIDSDKTHTTTDVYTAGNKRKVDSWIPIDNELKRLLLWHALTRERRFDGENPVLMVDDDPVDKPSNRLPTTTGWKRVKELTVPLTRSISGSPFLLTDSKSLVSTPSILCSPSHSNRFFFGCNRSADFG